MSIQRDREVLAREIADEIRHRRMGLDREDEQAAGTVHRSYARAKKYRDQDRAMIQGMVIALTYVLGCPLDMQKTDAFINQTEAAL